jgi:Zinc knuckle
MHFQDARDDLAGGGAGGDGLRPRPLNEAEKAQLRRSFISEMPLYDGKSSSRLWLQQYKASLREYGYDEKFAIMQIHNFMKVPEVIPWYDGVKNQLGERLYGNDPDYEELWEEFQTEFQSFFNEKNMKSNAHRELKALRYDSFAAPKNYVAKKKEILTRINPRISEEDITRKILDGLPSHIRLALVAAPTETTNELLQVLEKYADIKADKQAPSNSQSVSTTHAPSTSTQYQSPQVNASMSEVSQARVPQCYHCNAIGHVKRRCPQLMGNYDNGNKGYGPSGPKQDPKGYQGYQNAGPVPLSQIYIPNPFPPNPQYPNPPIPPHPQHPPAQSQMNPGAPGQNFP